MVDHATAVLVVIPGAGSGSSHACAHSCAMTSRSRSTPSDADKPIHHGRAVKSGGDAQSPCRERPAPVNVVERGTYAVTGGGSADKTSAVCAPISRSP